MHATQREMHIHQSGPLPVLSWAGSDRSNQDDAMCTHRSPSGRRLRKVFKRRRRQCEHECPQVPMRAPPPLQTGEDGAAATAARWICRRHCSPLHTECKPHHSDQLTFRHVCGVFTVVSVCVRLPPVRCALVVVVVARSIARRLMQQSVAVGLSPVSSAKHSLTHAHGTNAHGRKARRIHQRNV